MGGTVLKVNVAVAIVTYIWIHNVAFDIPIFIWTNVYFRTCFAKRNTIYVIVASIINFYVPLTIMWTSNIGIIYKLKRIMNRVILFYLFHHLL